MGPEGMEMPSLIDAAGARYDKRAAIFDGSVQVASIRIWLRDLTSSKTGPEPTCGRRTLAIRILRSTSFRREDGEQARKALVDVCAA